MANRLLLAICCLTLQSVSTIAQAPSNVHVTTNNGVVFGEKINFIREKDPIVNATFDRFIGIPFAEPPLGQRRFRKPEPVSDWPDAWNATFYRKQCWQLLLENFTGPQDEDCLYLNIWSPDVNGAKKPVMVWIHGGGFVLGTANTGPYDGTVLTSLYDIVYVSINYRLNGFGFVSTGDEELPGNYGLWDQVLALKWIKENIGAFGGDAGNITIFGQSAGGASCGHHLVHPGSWNYFDRAIMLSGNTMSPWGQETEIQNARSDAFLLGRAAGCGLLSSSRDLADCLRGIDAYRLTVAINAVLLQTTNNIPLGPVVDGDFFLSKSRSLLDMGQFKRCNVILGSTADDGTIVTARAYPSELLANVPVSDYETFTEKLAQFTYTYSNDVIVRAIQQQYVDWEERDDDSTNYFYDFVNVATDEAFLCPAEYMGRAYSKAGLSVYRALFNHKPEQSTWPDRLVKWRGVAHSEDNPFTFGIGFNPDRGHTFSSDEATLSLAMMEYYTNFAKTGNPNQNSDGDGVENKWEPFTLTEPYMKELKPKLDNLIGFRASYCAMHNNLIPDLIANTGAWFSLRLHILTRNMSEKKEKSRSIFDFFKAKERSCSDIEMTDLSSSMALKDPDPTGHNIATTAAGKYDIISSSSADTPLAVEPKDRPSGSISDSPVVCSGHTPLPDEPHQPHDVTFMLPQTVKMGGRAGNKTKTLTFQRQWCNEFPWIHCDTNLNKVLCYTCCKAVQNKLLNESYHRSEGAFLVDGFSSWKRARDAFKSHEKSEIHRSAREILLNLSKKDIISQLDDHHHSDQENARDALIKIVTSIRYLASEGSALRGKEHDSGKFKKLLRLRSEDDRNLAAWLGRKHNYTYSDIVNEILEIMGHDIMRDIVEKVNKESIQFGIICDGTQDISGKEQEAICIRYITSNFQICEDFIGLYNQGDTTGAGLAKMLQDVLLRVQLPVANLRAQTYDGAGNMAGEYNGCQANIKRVQPLCIYTHCGAHVSHLVTSKSIEKSVTMRDALDCVQELGKFSNHSGKFRELYSNLPSEETMQSPTSLKPICPTRWLTRAPAVISVLSNYAAALTALKKAADMFGSTSGVRASGLYNNLMSTKTLVGLKMALPILQVMESFNKSLQGKNQTVAGMFVVVESLKRELQSLRSEDTFHKIFVEAEEMAESLSLEELSLPRVRKIPMRIEGGVATHNFNTVEEYYRPQYFQVLDAALANLDAYFTSTDLTEYGKLTDMLVTGVYNAVVSERYPELTADLEQELAFFHRNFTVTHISDLQDEFESMTPEVRRMFQQVERLLRIILVNPASSCTAERSFSSLRRLKTWLRSTMTQSRLNHLMLCNVHSDLLEKMDSQIIAEKFISNKPDARRKVFGCFK